MKVIDDEDYDDENWGLFKRQGKIYADITPTLSELQEAINTGVCDEPRDQIAVMTTMKHQQAIMAIPTDDLFFITNFSCDRKPFNKYGNIKGRPADDVPPEILWKVEKPQCPRDTPEKKREVVSKLLRLSLRLITGLLRVPPKNKPENPPPKAEHLRNLQTT